MFRIVSTLFAFVLLVGNFASAQTSPCDSLTIESVKFDPFSDSLVLVQVSNPSFQNFDYPNFVLLDNNNGDTVAIETVNFFGIAQESTHSLSIHPDWNGNTTLTGRLDLYTGFGQSLACTFLRPVQLCPPDSCTWTYIAIDGFGQGGGDVDWVLSDSTGIELGSGTLQLGFGQQSDMDSLCLQPGPYTVEYDRNGGGGGPGGIQIWANLMNEYPSQNFFQQPLFGQDPLVVDFDLFPACMEVPEPAAVTSQIAMDLAITGFMAGSHLTLNRNNSTKPIGLVQVFDVSGKLLLQKQVQGAAGTIDLAPLPSGLYIIRADAPAPQHFKVFR